MPRTKTSMMAARGGWRWCVVWTSFVVFLAYFPRIAWTNPARCSAVCECLGTLVDCSNKDLSQVPDDIPDWVENLDLSSNKLSNVSALAGQGLDNLKKLVISNNQLSSLNESVLAALPNLKKLTLNYNDFEEIPLLPRSTNLTSLSLQHNNVKEIRAEVLDRMPRLRHLDLGHNQIQQLTVDMFPLHPALHQLYLNNNRLREIEKGALRNLPSLTWLKLNKNKIRHLPKEAFANLTKLQDLELSRNRLQVIDGLTFKGLARLVTLKLDRNMITQLMDGAFYGPSNVQNLILDHNNITTITKGWLYGLSRLEVLNLSHNRVSHVEDDVWTTCELLSKLDLRYNELSLVKEGTFTHLTSLQHLILDNNRMSYVAQGAFRDLVSLHILDLNNNEISWTIEDMNGAFQGLANLRQFSLRNNHIKLIANGAFDGLDKLQQLHLEENQLTGIQMNAFSELPSLQELHFNTSSLVCDCQLAWFSPWLATKEFKMLVVGKCIHPDSLAGQNVVDVAEEDFKCDDSPKPVIQVQPESQAALQGSNTSLECVAVSSDPSNLTAQWRKDNIMLTGEDYRIEKFERATSEGVLELRSVMIIRDLQDQHSGVFQCVVSNNLGTAYSTKAEITVNVLPYFVKTPEDVMSRAGQTARLECEAAGLPTPRIAWKKDGGDNFPSARDRRLLMMPTDNVFFITRVNTEDEGVYSCTAENEVGSVVANATLRVLEKPVLARKMEDKVVKKGTTAVLDCMATGSPRPEIMWFKDGEPLLIPEDDQRHFLTADNQLLVIYQVLDADEGIYTCRVSNTLAKDEDTSRLTVVDHAVNSDLTSRKEPESQGQTGIFGDDSMMTGIIIIAVVCCVVGTSVIWVIIIYKTRKRTEEYSSTPTDETTLPGDMPSTPYHSSDRDSSSPGLITANGGLNAFGKYPVMEVNGGFGYSPAKVRMAAIFPSDIQDDHTRQSVPLTSDEQQPAESSDTSIAMLRQGRHSTGSSDQSSPSPHQSLHSLQSSRSAVLQTFQPHLSRLGQCPHHTSPLASCEDCRSTAASTTIATVHSAARCDSCPRLDVIVSEDEPEVQKSADEVAIEVEDCHSNWPSGQPGTDCYSATFPAHCASSTPSSLPGPSQPSSVSSHGTLTSPSVPWQPRTAGSSQPEVSVARRVPVPQHRALNSSYLDSCTDSESCVEEEDEGCPYLSDVPEVTVIPSWYSDPNPAYYKPPSSVLSPSDCRES